MNNRRKASESLRPAAKGKSAEGNVFGKRSPGCGAKSAVTVIII